MHSLTSLLRVLLLLLVFESPCAACPQGEAPPPPRRYGLDLFWSVITSAPGRLPAEVVTMAQAAFVEVFKSKHFPTEVRGALAAWLVARVSEWGGSASAVGHVCRSWL